MNIKRMFGRIADSRGSSLIMALVTITILMLLGLAAITVSMSTLTSNVADATTNDSYYAAEAGVNAGLDQLKLEVSRYYMEMKAASATDYPGKFSNFAANIALNADYNFTEPSITGGTTQTTFTVESYDSANNVYGFLVTTTSTMADGTKYQVQGRLSVKRVDVSAKEWFIEDAALVVGRELNLLTIGGLGVKNGDSYLGSLTARASAFDPKNGSVTIDPSIEDSIENVLKYPSFSDPVISNPLYFASSTTINYPLPSPVRVDTAETVNLKITDSNIIPTGTLRSRGDLTINSGGNINCDIYCNNLTENGRRINGNIYAHGNVTITGGNLYGDLYCDGDVSLSSIGIYGSIIADGNVTIRGASTMNNIFAGGTIDLAGFGGSANVVYSRTKVVYGGAGMSAIVFSGGDVVFTSGCSVDGAVIAAKNMYFSSSGWCTISYNAAEVAQKYANLQDTFFRPGTGSTSVDSSVFSNQSITAKGRVN